MGLKSRLGEPVPKRVAILRALQLGDLMCAVPAFRALRHALPEAQITLIGLPWAQTFVERFNQYIDDLIELPGYPGLPERLPQIHRIPKFLEEVQWINFDLAIQMQGSGVITNSLVALLGARLNAGYYLQGQYCPDEERFIPYPVHESEVRIHLRLLEQLGVPAQGEHLEFPLFVEDWEELHELQEKYNLVADNYVLVHPGARAYDRRWPIEYFASVADGMFDRGLQVVLTGSQEEAHLTGTVATLMKNPVIDLAGQTSLGGMGALLSKARLLVCNDTGVSHLAAAVQTPSVILFTTSDPKRWAPKDQNLHRVVAWATAAIPEIVLDEVEELLLEERVYAI